MTSKKRERSDDYEYEEPETRNPISFKTKGGMKSRILDTLPWKRIDTSHESLGDFDDAMFFGLEEVDGDELAKLIQIPSNSSQSTIVGEDEVIVDKKPKKTIEKAKKVKPLKENQMTEKKVIDIAMPHVEMLWGSLQLHTLLALSLESLGYHDPTPIQASAVPATLSSRVDIVGIAETGSGKTLSFALPIFHTILMNWADYQQWKYPSALIITPTRELAMQISGVLNTISSAISERLRLSTINSTNDNIIHKFPRKIEIVSVIGGMASEKQIRQLSRTEKRAVDVIVATPGRLCDMMDKEDLFVFKDMSHFRYLVVDEVDRIMEEGHYPELQKILQRIREHEKTSTILQRQTLLYSATANQGMSSKKKVRGVGEGAVRTLPAHLQELLRLVGLHKHTQVIDVTQSSSSSAVPSPTLPKTLLQYEARMTSEAKDVMVYEYLLRCPGRVLVFVNSIKAARRLDGLLRALHVSSRSIHAELQQKQRLNALDSFRSTMNGVLVATDVAARGLDVSAITTVIHYDVARSPQLYLHRSGRTARASASGTTISFVSPEDLAHHDAICSYLGVKALDSWRAGVGVNGSLLEQRVKLAKKIFTQTFVQNQKVKESNWIRQTAEETGLDLDPSIVDEEEMEQKQKKVMTKKELSMLKYELDELLARPWTMNTSSYSSYSSSATSSKKRKNSFVVVAK